jgi:hypothetical protein
MSTSHLILKRASGSRSSGQWSDEDYDVLADGIVIGRVMKAAAAPVGTPWLWTLASGSMRTARQRTATSRRARLLWRDSPRAGGASKHQEPLARPCVSLTEPSNNRAEPPCMRVSETPPLGIRAGFSFWRVTLGFASLPLKKERAPAFAGQGSLWLLSVASLFGGRFTPRRRQFADVTRNKPEGFRATRSRGRGRPESGLGLAPWCNRPNSNWSSIT